MPKCRRITGPPPAERRYALDAQQLTLALNTQTSLNVATRDGRPEIELVAGEAAIQARASSPDDDAIEREAHAWARVLGAGRHP